MYIYGKTVFREVVSGVYRRCIAAMVRNGDGLMGWEVVSYIIECVVGIASLDVPTDGKK